MTTEKDGTVELQLSYGVCGSGLYGGGVAVRCDSGEQQLLLPALLALPYVSRCKKECKKE